MLLELVFIHDEVFNIRPEQVQRVLSRVVEKVCANASSCSLSQVMASLQECVRELDGLNAKLVLHGCSGVLFPFTS